MVRRTRLAAAFLLLPALLQVGASPCSGAATASADPAGARWISGLLLEERRGRVVAARVLPGSPAASAGLREGDVLLVIDDVPLVDLDVLSTREVFRIIDRLRGSSVRLVVGRGSTTRGATLPLRASEASMTTSPAGEIQVGRPAPEFTARDLSGLEVSLTALRGRPVLIDFWASWCPPCRDSAIALRRLADQYGDRLIIVGVSLDEDPRAFEAFVYNQHMPGRQISDGGPFGRIGVLYGVPAASIPYSVLISPDGTVLSVGNSLADKEEILVRLVGPPAPSD
jgi:thiol-disulfide isomerase/thioredoxin